jgi:hypothetical protein
MICLEQMNSRLQAFKTEKIQGLTTALQIYACDHHITDI